MIPVQSSFQELYEVLQTLIFHHNMIVGLLERACLIVETTYNVPTLFVDTHVLNSLIQLSWPACVCINLIPSPSLDIMHRFCNRTGIEALGGGIHVLSCVSFKEFSVHADTRTCALVIHRHVCVCVVRPVTWHMNPLGWMSLMTSAHHFQIL